MKSLRAILIVFYTIAMKANVRSDTYPQFFKHKLSSTNSYRQLLQDIQQERPFDSLLIVQQKHLQDPRLEVLYHLDVTKVIVTKGTAFQYKDNFNSNILSVILQDQELDFDLMEVAAEILQSMTHSRVLVVALNVMDKLSYKAKLLDVCCKYQMSNLLLIFVDHKKCEELHYYQQLKPYPSYHWHATNLPEMNRSNYFPQHWKNMHNTSLITITDGSMPRSLVYKDSQGSYRINGFVSRLIFLFAEHFNVSLKMYRPLDEPVLHFLQINQMVVENLVDIPMVLNPLTDVASLHDSYVYDVGHGRLMVPCAQALNTHEIFGLLLNVYFFTWIFISTWLLSMVYAMCYYIIDGIEIDRLQFLLNLKLLPGILGQSFVAFKTSSSSLKLVCMLVFFVGLYISSQFSANIKTLFTSSPYHVQIRTVDDIRHSSLKILFVAAEYAAICDYFVSIHHSVVLTTNVTWFQEIRNNFNTSYGYLVPSSMWKIYTRIQQYFTHHIFCSNDKLQILNGIPWTFKLHHNSPFREPLDYLIHRVHAAGLIDAWLSSTFDDMLKLKLISIRDHNPSEGVKSLSVHDFSQIWLMWFGGLLISSVIFVGELIVMWRLRRRFK